MTSEKWDLRFLTLAFLVASWSKDPSTKCGAVIVRGNRIISLGYNGFPQGVYDHNERLQDRETKYKMVLHAEVNALMFANVDLTGCTIYTVPMPPCSRCAAQIIQAGIKRVVALVPSADMLTRWGADFDIAKAMYRDALVTLDTVYELND